VVIPDREEEDDRQEKEPLEERSEARSRQR
jgi:hypothetical protein